MHVNKHVRTCEGVRVSERAPQGWRERVRKNSVDRKHEGTQRAERPGPQLEPGSTAGSRGCGLRTGGCWPRGRAQMKKKQRAGWSGRVGGEARH